MEEMINKQSVSNQTKQTFEDYNTRHLKTFFIETSLFSKYYSFK